MVATLGPPGAPSELPLQRFSGLASPIFLFILNPDFWVFNDFSCWFVLTVLQCFHLFRSLLTVHPLPSTCYQGTSSSGGYCLLSTCRVPHPVLSAVYSLEFKEPWVEVGCPQLCHLLMGSPGQQGAGCPDTGGGSWLWCIAAAGMAAQRSAQVLRGHVRRHFRGWRCVCYHPQIGGK